MAVRRYPIAQSSPRPLKIVLPVRKDFRRWLAAEKGGRRLKMKSRRDIAAANKAGWAGLYCRCAENSECGCGACE